MNLSNIARVSSGTFPSTSTIARRAPSTAVLCPIGPPSGYDNDDRGQRGDAVQRHTHGMQSVKVRVAGNGSRHDPVAVDGTGGAHHDSGPAPKGSIDDRDDESETHTHR